MCSSLHIFVCHILVVCQCFQCNSEDEQFLGSNKQVKCSPKQNLKNKPEQGQNKSRTLQLTLFIVSGRKIYQGSFGRTGEYSTQWFTTTALAIVILHGGYGAKVSLLSQSGLECSGSLEILEMREVDTHPVITQRSRERRGRV